MSDTANANNITPAKAAYLGGLADAAETQDLTQDMRPQVRKLSITFTVLAAVFVALRFLARSRRAARVGTDDWLILVSLVLLVGNLAMNLISMCWLGIGSADWMWH